MTIIKTKTFMLRPIRLSDVKPYFETMQDSETQRNLSSFPKTLTQARKDVKEMLNEVKDKDSEIFSIEVHGRYAGNVLLQHQKWDIESVEGRVHLWIHPKFRDKGLATKALDKIIDYGLRKKFKRIFAQCKVFNNGIIKINKRLGMRKMKTFVDDSGVKKILWVKEK